MGFIAKKKKIFIFMFAGSLTALLLMMFICLALWYTKCSTDFSRLKEEEYDTVFFSMYSTENYEEADYTHFRGMNIVRTSYAIPDTRIMEIYMDAAVQSGNTISTAYLGIDPEKARVEDVFQIALENPGIMFEIVLAYPQIEYWLDMDEEAYQNALEAYRDFAGNVLGLENVRVYYFNHGEWLVCNPANYIAPFQTNEEVSRLLMCNTDEQHSYILNVENFHERFNQAQALVEKYRQEPAEYVNVSEWEIVFFGDSVIGNYQGSLSIPGVVNGLTKAAVYNLGYGGKCAALCEKTKEPLPVIVEAFINQDFSGIPKEAQIYAGLEAYSIATQKTAATQGQLPYDGTPDMFVINYGLNDYFNGVPVDAEDPYDISSYSGALRTAVKALQEEYPDAQILLLTPNLSINFDFGEGVQSEVGGRLQDYADAVLALAEELQVEVLDNFRELPIRKNVYWEFLADGTHPNEQGRFLMGTRIAKKIESMLTK